MKNTIWVGGALLAALAFSGCQTELAEQPLPPTEAAWNDYLSSTYSSWERPALAAPTEPQSAKAQYPAQAEPVQKHTTDLSRLPDEPVGNADEGTVVVQEETVVFQELPEPEEKTETMKKPETIGNKEVLKANPIQGAEYTVVTGDSFWKISQKVYGNGKYFQKLINANTEKYPQLKKNPNRLRVGMKLVVPEIEAAVKPVQAPQTAPDATSDSGFQIQ